jgi:cellulose synthase/poly-beta-1,6-N-acetylglucosamine synthase-like glycosyltransferase
LGGTRLVWERSLLLLAAAGGIYAWAGYPCLLWLLVRLFRRPVAANSEMAKPLVSIVLSVHNEGKRIAGKLQDCLNLQYPRERLEILVVSDGSTDATEDLVREFAARDPRIRLFHTERVGKSCAQNLAIGNARGEILLLTDAETRIPPDGLQQIVRNFADPQVGLVTVVVKLGEPGDAVSKGQGLYWRYEFWLRQAESDLGILATAGGCALAMRRELFLPMESCYGDDCVLPLDVRLQGYRVVQDPEATVFDTFPHTIEGELRARVRMTSRNWTGTLSRAALLNPLRFPFTSFGLVSHKLLRWLTPFLLATIFVANTVLLFHREQVALWVVQVLFYLFAFVGWRRARREKPAGVFAFPFSFCLANVGFFLGIVRVFRNQRIVAY